MPDYPAIDQRAIEALQELSTAGSNDFLREIITLYLQDTPLLLAQLEQAQSFIDKRKENFNYLHSRLSACEEFLILPKATPNSNPSWFGFPITLKEDAPVARLELLQYLDQKKVGTRLLFAGNLIRQPYMLGRNYRVSGSLENTDRVMNQTFWIGVQPALTQEMLNYSVKQIETYLGLKFD
jgi:CDP-6-deoxy-D-xylo-4-hexulose-3-dehydrase